MSGHPLQFLTLYALVGALAGLALYLWERTHRRRLDVMLPVYVLIGALFGGAALILIAISMPGILLLKAQVAWSRHVRKNVPVEFPWADPVTGKIFAADFLDRAKSPDSPHSVKTPRTR